MANFNFQILELPGARAWGCVRPGMGMGGRSQPCTHPGGCRHSGCPTPSRHPAQSFPWELLHSKEPRDALPDVCPSKAGNQGSPAVFRCVETPGDALSKATGDRGPGGHSIRLGACRTGLTSSWTLSKDPLSLLLQPWLFSLSWLQAGAGCSGEQRCFSRLRTLYRVGKSLFRASLPDGYLRKH